MLPSTSEGLQSFMSFWYTAYHIPCFKQGLEYLIHFFGGFVALIWVHDGFVKVIGSRSLAQGSRSL